MSSAKNLQINVEEKRNLVTQGLGFQLKAKALGGKAKATSCTAEDFGKIVALTLYRMVMPIGTPFLKEKNNN